MPDNPLKKNAGNKIRALSLLEYFKSRAFHVHFVSEYHWGEWNPEEIATFQTSGLAQQVTVLHRKPSKKNILSYFFYFKIPQFFYNKKWGFLPLHFPDLVTFKLKKAFRAVLKRDEYDFVLINYASWASLIESNRFVGKATTILDTHDLLTAQNPGYKYFGASFQEEIRRLSLFQHIFAISIEEQYIFEQFLNRKVSLVPMMIAKPEKRFIPIPDRTIDILYVASNNPHNIEAARWFMHEVYPLLDKSYHICIVGQITDSIDPGHPNITCIPFAEDLDSYYQNSKITICPMRSGTGTKIKVVESLAHEVPVVCNKRGIDGLINKLNNGCLIGDDPEQFKNNIYALLTDTELYKQQALYAKVMYEAIYELESCRTKLDQLFL